MKCFLIVFSIFLTFRLSAQVNTATWGVEDTVLNIVKTTDFGVVHDYLEIYNYSNEDLDMRWIPAVDNSWPTQWIPYFNDLDSSYTNPHFEDSADFVMLNPPGFSNKLIFSVDHQSHAANSMMSFKVFPINHPEDSLWIHYYVYIGEPEELSIAEDESGVDLFYNPQNQQLKIQNPENKMDLFVHDLSGKMVINKKLTNGGDELISMNSLKSGVYIVKLTDQSDNLIKTFKFNK